MPHQDGSFLDADLDLWRVIAHVNLHGTVLRTKYALPHLVAAAAGTVTRLDATVHTAAAQFGIGGQETDLFPDPLETP